MKIKEFPNGLTVKELKDIIKDWPEQYNDGEPTTVWISIRSNLSDEVTEVSPLNLQDGAKADLILSNTRKP